MNPFDSSPQGLAPLLHRTLALAVVALCLGFMPHNTAQAASLDGDALVRDLITLVAVGEKRIWTIDTVEIDALSGPALECVCRADNATREHAKDILKTRIETMGGDPEATWKKQGKSFAAIAEVMTVVRTQKLLERTIARAEQDCPFYVEPTRPYIERHRPDGRLLIGVEGGGLFNARFSGDQTRFGGGGSGRISFNWGLNSEWHLRFGGEFGGAGLTDEELDTADIEFDVYLTLPIGIRHRGLLWHQDIEVGPVAFGTWQEEVRYGIRGAAMIGLTYTRLANVQPWAGLRIGAQYGPEHCRKVIDTNTSNLNNQETCDPSALTLRLGVRVGFDYHL